DWSSDVCSSDLQTRLHGFGVFRTAEGTSLQIIRVLLGLGGGWRDRSRGRSDLVGCGHLAFQWWRRLLLAEAGNQVTQVVAALRGFARLRRRWHRRRRDPGAGNGAASASV